MNTERILQDNLSVLGYITIEVNIWISRLQIVRVSSCRGGFGNVKSEFQVYRLYCPKVRAGLPGGV
jgi:hypothetical protein